MSSQETDLVAEPSATDWSAYAAAYDLLAEHNPAYQDLLADFAKFLSSIPAPGVILDLGGGTGNYTAIAARQFPQSTIHFVEPDVGMTRAAQAKLAGHDNILYQTRGVEAVRADATADLVVCAHALYTMPDPQQRLVDMHRMLKPGGLIYLVDLGRYLNLADWRSYLFAHLRGRHGLAGALRIFWQAREIARQNANILAAQKNGDYWIHSAADFAQAVTAAGFEIVSQTKVYRGYSDQIVARARH